MWVAVKKAHGFFSGEAPSGFTGCMDFFRAVDEIASGLWPSGPLGFRVARGLIRAVLNCQVPR